MVPNNLCNLRNLWIPSVVDSPFPCPANNHPLPASPGLARRLGIGGDTASLDAALSRLSSALDSFPDP